MIQGAKTAGLVLLALVVVALFSCRQQGREIIFGGGPSGGTFQRFAEGIADVMEQGMPEIRVKVEHSGGSLANLRDVLAGKREMALVYAGDIFRGETGGELPAGHNLRLVARVYGAAAHLVVLQSSRIYSPFDLRRKRVAIGGAGSGAAQAAESYFRALGIWDELIPIHLGYSLAMGDLSRGTVEAVWELVGAPSVSVQQIGRTIPVRLLDLSDAGRKSGFFAQHPYYTESLLAPLTYPGQDYDVRTFQDAALWVAAEEMDEQLVYRALELLFREQGLARMRQTHPVAGSLSLRTGLPDLDLPLHPGAKAFWQERRIRPTELDHRQPRPGRAEAFGG